MGGALHASCRARVYVSGENVFEGNRALRYGGAISIRNATLDIGVGSHFLRNYGIRGGGGIAVLSELPFAASGYLPSLSEVMSGEVVTPETKLYPCYQPPEVRVDGAVFQENGTMLYGGGVYLWRPDRDERPDYDVLELAHCWFEANGARAGAAVAVSRDGVVDGESRITLHGCTLLGRDWGRLPCLTFSSRATRSAGMAWWREDKSFCTIQR